MVLKEKNSKESGEEKEGESDAGASSGKASKKQSSNTMVLVLIVLGVVMLLVAGGGIGYAIVLLKQPVAAGSEASKEEHAPADKKEESKEESKEKKEIKPPVYLELKPSFIVQVHQSGSDEATVMQIDVSLMARDEKLLEKIKANEPRVRNDLLKLFSMQNPSDIITISAKEKLQEDAKKIVNEILKEQNEKEEVESILFTNFLVQ